jgi:hypothetical protein
MNSVYSDFATPTIDPNGIHTLESPTFTQPYRPGELGRPSHCRGDGLGERKETVKVNCTAVRKVSTKALSQSAPPNFKLTLPPGTALWLTSMRFFRLHVISAERRQVMGVVIFIGLTVAVFAVLGLAQKLVERL